MTKNLVMKELRINISEAKAKLSQYVRRVKNGEKVVLCERNVPVAEIRTLGQVEENQSVYKSGSLKKVNSGDSEEEPVNLAWGAMAGTVIEFPDDFNEPEGDADWEASK